jgi:hypothetical protein
MKASKATNKEGDNISEKREKIEIEQKRKFLL